MLATAPTAAAAQSLVDTKPATNEPEKPSRGRVTILALPLMRTEGVLGEIEVEIDSEGSARFERSSLLRLLGPLLSDDGMATVAKAFASQDYLAANTLADAGIVLQFDMSQLEVRLISLAPELTPVVDLNSRDRRLENRPPTVQPAGFSAFLNLAGNFDYSEGPALGSDFRSPDIFAFGATRMGQFALQYEGGATVIDNGEYGLYRRFVRGIYDDEDRNLRISAGDLQSTSLPLLGTQLLGGVAIERRRRIFDPFEPVFQLGGRRLRINSPSTIEIVNNGNLIRTIPVDQGIYDLEELPLLFGSNDVEILIRDAAGRTSVTNFNYFFDPVDLEVGDYEFGVFAGLTSDIAQLEPTYGGDLGASAYYRKALSASALVGGAVQLTQDTQTAAVEVRLVPQIIPGVVEAQIGVSQGDRGVGFAARTGYRWARNTVAGTRQISFLLDYESSKFQLVGQPDLFEQERVTVNATYGQNISSRTFLNIGLSQLVRGSRPTQTNLFADVVHQFNDRLRATAGAEYGRNDGFDTAFGVRVGVTYLLGRNSRVNADAQSRRSLYRVGINRGLDNQVGAWGYDANFEQSDGDSLADAAFQYRGNRFDGRLLVQTSGNSIGGITDERRAQLQLSTSLAFADGAFGIGRTITDGFALVQPTKGIKGNAIVGNNLNDGEYQGRSGFFGAAVVPDVLGYQTREIIYDIDAKGTVFDVGEGTDRVRIATGGGAKIVIGNTRFVSAVGTLWSGDAPAALVSGRVVSDTDDGFEEMQFFTNSAGRFSIIGLAPLQTYRVELRDNRQFELTVPDTDQGLYRVGRIITKEVTE